VCCAFPVQAKQSITLAFGQWAPYHSTSLPGNGLASMIYSEAFALEGIDVKYDVLPWKRGYDLAMRGEVHGSVGWLKTDERERHFIFSDPVMFSRVVMFHKRDLDLNWETLEDIKNYQVVLPLGDLSHELVRPAMRGGRGGVQTSNNYLLGMKMLIEGRADIFICNAEVGKFLLTTHFPHVNNVTQHPTPVIKGASHLIISRNIPNGQALVKRFNKGLKTLKQNGRYDDIFNIFYNPAKSVILSTGDWAPFYSSTIPHGGIANRIVAEAFAEMNVLAVFQFGTWERAMQVAQYGPAVGSSGWLMNQERQRDFLYSDPIFTSKRVFFYHESKRFSWRSLEDLKGLRVGVTKGSLGEFPFDDLVRSGKIKLHISPNYPAGMKALSAGQVDVYACNYTVGQYILENQVSAEVGKGIVSHPKPIFAEENHLIISKRLHDADELLLIFNEGLRRLKESGRLDEVFNKLALE